MKNTKKSDVAATFRLRKNKNNLNILGIIAKGRNAVIGVENIKSYLKKIKTKTGFLIVAKDASEKTKRKANYLKEKYGLPLIELGTKKEIAKYFKKQEISVIYVKNRGFLDSLTSG